MLPATPFPASTVIMPSKVAFDLSLLELLQVLNEKVALEYASARKIRPPPGVASSPP
jgi:hypothetical protein